MSKTQKELVVGSISPTSRPDSGAENQLDQKLPAAIRLINLSMNFIRGTEEEFAAAMPGYESKVAQLVALGADLVRATGAPPFMLLGFQGERDKIRAWQRQYQVPIFTSGQNHVRALRTLRVKKFVGASYFPARLNETFTRYFTEAGFQVLAMEGIQVPFAEVPKLPAAEVFEHIRAIFTQHREAEAIYMLGSAWKTLDIIDELEQALGVSVIHPAPARCWETQVRLGFSAPIPGYGRLLAEMPPPAAEI